MDSDVVDARARGLWARTRVHVWPEPYVLVSLPVSRQADAAGILASAHGFAAVVVERDEVSLTLREDDWRACAWRDQAAAVDGPYRALTLDLDIALDVCGYLAPAAARLGAAGVSIVPQCAFRKDHLLVREAQLVVAVGVLETLIAEAARTT